MRIKQTSQTSPLIRYINSTNNFEKFEQVDNLISYNINLYDITGKNNKTHLAAVLELPQNNKPPLYIVLEATTKDKIKNTQLAYIEVKLGHEHKTIFGLQNVSNKQFVSWVKMGEPSSFKMIKKIDMGNLIIGKGDYRLMLADPLTVILKHQLLTLPYVIKSDSNKAVHDFEVSRSEDLLSNLKVDYWNYHLRDPMYRKLLLNYQLSLFVNDPSYVNLAKSFYFLENKHLWLGLMNDLDKNKSFSFYPDFDVYNSFFIKEFK